MIGPAAALRVIPHPVGARQQSAGEPLSKNKVVDRHALAMSVAAAYGPVPGARVQEVGTGRFAIVDLRPHRDDGVPGIARRLTLSVEAAVEVAQDSESVVGRGALVDPVLQHRHLALQQPAVVAVRGQRVAVAGGLQVHGE